MREHDLYRVCDPGEVGVVADASVSPSSSSEPTPPSAPLPASPCIAQKAIEEQLALYPGPIGKVLVRRELKSGATPQVALRNLADHIENPRDRATFLSKAEAVLLSHGSAVGVISSAATPAPGVRERTPPPTQGSEITHWSPHELQIATGHLMEYVGPLSRVLVHRVARHARDVSTLYRGLAEHIPQDAERERLLREVGIADGA